VGDGIQRLVNMTFKNGYFKKIIQILFYLCSYPVLSTFFTLLGLGSFWSPLVFYFSLLMILMTAIFLIPQILKNSPNPTSITLIFSIPFLLSLYFNPKDVSYARIGFFIVGGAFLIVSYVLRAFRIFLRLVAESVKSILSYWIIFILATSIVTSICLSTLNEVINLVPVFLIGLIFGWLAPEVTYRFISKEESGPVLAAVLYVALSVLIGFIYDIILGDYLFFQNLEPDGPAVGIASCIAVPSMLLSRIILETLKGLTFKD
jgi:hypothetical protein